VQPGEERAAIVEQRLSTAQIVLVLVSASYNACDARYAEMERALASPAGRSGRVIPVRLRDVDQPPPPLEGLAGLPSHGGPVASWPRQDEAWSEVVRGVRRIVASMPTGTENLGYWRRRGSELHQDDWKAGNREVISAAEVCALLAECIEDLPEDEDARTAALGAATQGYLEGAKAMVAAP
jgi:hypothetical protein